jgi:hypothetical protein
MARTTEIRLAEFYSVHGFMNNLMSACSSADLALSSIDGRPAAFVSSPGCNVTAAVLQRS